ncbi:DUF1638 domain-containing protein [Oscillospiraceae bacterium LTW-04]|nr:DUF1638 domain-containing protein [Oscillospiraceae bacterium MB24-C1]
MNIKVLGCQQLRRELYMLAVISSHEVVIDLISSSSSIELIQQKINDEGHADLIVLAMGECAAQGLCSSDRPLAIARVHNCAHLLLGSTERFHKAFSENEDAPCWQMMPQCQKCMPHRGVPCVVASTLTGSASLPLQSGIREYVADLTLLKKLLNAEWDGDTLVVSPHSRIVADPVEILSIEPV